MKKIVFICAAMIAFAATAFAQECEYDQQTGVIKIWKHTGMLKGYFTVNAEGKQVRFSQGNLQYNSDTQKWQFAEHQYDRIGNAGGNRNVTADGLPNNSGVADLFGWVGASSTWTGLKQYGLVRSNATNAVDGYGNVADENLKSDWGTLMGSTWRTLTDAEWNYVFKSRTGISVAGYNTAYAGVKISDLSNLQCVILFPDGGVFEASEFSEVLKYWNYQVPILTITLEQWNALEEKGCVLFVGGGKRYEGSSYYDGYEYWSSTPRDATSAYYEYLTPGGEGVHLSYVGYTRSTGMSVRLVKDVVTP